MFTSLSSVHKEEEVTLQRCITTTLAPRGWPFALLLSGLGGTISSQASGSADAKEMI